QMRLQRLEVPDTGDVDPGLTLAVALQMNSRPPGGVSLRQRVGASGGQRRGGGHRTGSDGSGAPWWCSAINNSRKPLDIPVYAPIIMIVQCHKKPLSPYPTVKE